MQKPNIASMSNRMISKTSFHPTIVSGIPVVCKVRLQVHTLSKDRLNIGFRSLYSLERAFSDLHLHR
jgi:hypothetical protein